MRRFLFLSLGLSLFFPLEALRAVSLSVAAQNKKKEARVAMEAQYDERGESNDEDSDGDDDEDDGNKEKEPESAIQYMKLEDGREVLRVNNGSNESTTITEKNEDGTAKEITKTLSAESRTFDNEPQELDISPSPYYPPPPSSGSTSSTSTADRK